MRRKIRIADLLCGAGGSSTGCMQALQALGFESRDIVMYCLNHWPIAIDTHRRNHPEALHYVQDIAVARPHLIVPEGYLDLLMASPTCTHHSVARGGRPTSDQQRSDPWHIITWLTELRVKRLIIENVWEFIGWGPVDHRTGRPVASRKGEYFRAWIETIRKLGFEPEWRKLNAADYGDATTRQRFILMARSDRRRVLWPVPTHGPRGSEGCGLFSDDDRFPGVRPWRPAREIIDWSIKGRSIFGRKKALAPKTLSRIYAGAIKFNWPEPFLVILRNHMSAQGVDNPLLTIAAGGQHIGLAQPAIINMKKSAAPGSLDSPLPTQTSVASHIGIAEPFVLSQASGGAPRSVGEPIPTVTTGGNGAAHALISPYYGTGSGEICSSVHSPLPTVTSKGRFGMVVPVTQSGGGPSARDIADPIPTLPTVTGANRGELALISAQFDDDGPAPRVHEGVGGYDILFRMLEPHELAAAMGFDTADVTYEFAGNKAQKIKQIGNAVSVAKMRACVGAIMADAVPARVREAAE